MIYDSHENNTPLQTPVTILDLERGPIMAMELPLADPCPRCGAFRMMVGDYICFTACKPCWYPHYGWRKTL